MRHAGEQPQPNALEPRQRALLTAAFIGICLYGAAPAYDALVQAGVLDGPKAAPEVSIPQITLAIAVNPADLPKQRPSASAARIADQIESAYVVGALARAASSPASAIAEDDSDVPPEFNLVGSGDPMLVVVLPTGDETTVAEFPPPRRTSALSGLAKPSARNGSGEETMDAVRKRVFAPDR